jgi:ABC-type multidrug transport system fused ATPase/permease subunit
MSSTHLPVAELAGVRRYARSLVRRHPRALGWMLALHTLAAVTGLAGPWLLGGLVESVRNGTTTSHVDHVALTLAVFVVVQTVLTRRARLASLVLGEEVLAELREDFVRTVVGLPLSTVERAGTGDLLTRTTGDIDTVARSVRFAAPEILIAAVTTLLTLVAAALVAPVLVLCAFVVLPLLWFSTRWYLRRAPSGYLAEREAYSVLNGTIAETADAGRTIEALRLQQRRIDRTDADVRRALAAERRTLYLRSMWFPAVDLGFAIPMVAVVLGGGLLNARGVVTLGQVTAVALYMQQLVEPLDVLLSWLDELQVGGTALARLVGVGDVPPDRTATGEQPADEHVQARDVRFSYAPPSSAVRDVLHGIDLDVRPGERLAIVGPSGAGKSTLGRLLAGIHPPRTGAVEVGGVPLVDLELDELRRQVALVTQEHHVFVGTIADNLRLARPSAGDDALRAALEAVDAMEWVDALPDGLATAVGSGELRLTPAQSQQVALGRLVLADPHTLVLDEATSLLDPRAARHLERSLAAVLDGRTVVAIAHRLHTAHDADRVAVVEDGRLMEIGTHDELVAAGGAYADLWHSWRSEGSRLGT